MSKLPRFQAVRRVGSALDRGLQRIGNPTGKIGGRIQGIEHLIYGGELAAGAYLIGRQIKKNRKNKQKYQYLQKYHANKINKKSIIP